MIKSQKILSHRLFKNIISLLDSNPYEPKATDLRRMASNLRTQGIQASVTDVREFFKLLQAEDLGFVEPPKNYSDADRFRWTTSMKDFVGECYGRPVSKKKDKTPIPQNKTLKLELRKNINATVNLPSDVSDKELSRLILFLEAHKKSAQGNPRIYKSLYYFTYIPKYDNINNMSNSKPQEFWIKKGTEPSANSFTIAYVCGYEPATKFAAIHVREVTPEDAKLREVFEEVMKYLNDISHANFGEDKTNYGRLNSLRILENLSKGIGVKTEMHSFVRLKSFLQTGWSANIEYGAGKTLSVQSFLAKALGIPENDMSITSADHDTAMSFLETRIRQSISSTSGARREGSVSGLTTANAVVPLAPHETRFTIKPEVSS